ncbi:cytochrome P450 [Mycena belliarum]|uniref:Cytochrome P450 n=1 Tax=Mycena belliarum TaxID=1033014 RepID=A0AAD6U9I2_9AGAR|nr:cytochrome P450 [Mycena belliae]
MPLTSIDLALAGLGLFLLFKLATPRTGPAPPPGPKPLPIIGNLLDMPSGREWTTFAKWGEIYGDISSVKVFGRQMTILNNVHDAIALLDKKSAITSDRVIVPMGGELAGWNTTLGLIPYGDRFRNYRRLAHSLFGSRASMANFEPLEEQETHRFLQRILAEPTELQEHIRKTAGALILRVTYGYEVQEGNDPFVAVADVATTQLSLGTSPTGFVVNMIPPLRHIPSWFPGAGFKRIASSWRKTLNKMADEPYGFAKEQMAAGTADSSVVHSLLDGKKLSAEEEFDVKWMAASLYTGMDLTYRCPATVATIYAFFKAMVLYPDIQEKVQREIDSVVGNERLPLLADREQLPYTAAVTLETLRWHSVAPIGIPHRVTEDHVHDGHFLPKGGVVIANIWQMAHDPRVYPNPMLFNPERFLAKDGKKNELDPREIVFGFGRRKIGRALADASVFISIAMTLAVFDIKKDPRAPEIDTDHTAGMISHPTTFECLLEPRSERARELIAGEGR